ncbi:PRTRC system ThiF family protein [Deinococcus ruber]|uniref:Thiazole biosynthesis adenylyltransferase ThiF n=1 Tax=Deinococcus ruber TaxID=1848197 RepID=A0A918FAX4_9DEIO|nr:PRTRC system ThiF family protein [Deinococcus ruber]GGR17327.1 thiazole biosynthesis adenylyltransferase ThiF [Deinococcus ruber]
MHHTHALKFSPRQLINVVLVGVGGTGSALLTYLTDIHKCLQALDGAGLHVTVFDGAAVSSTNVIRQNYSPAEIGRNKAVSLVGRVNATLGTAWIARPSSCTLKDLAALNPHILITCTDTKVSRRTLGEFRVPYWLDTGNSDFTGQVVLSEPGLGLSTPHLPTPLETHAAHLKGNQEAAASCSALEALQRQDLMINRQVALQATALLWRLLRDGHTSTRGAYIDTSTGTVLPLLVEPHMVKPNVVSVGLMPPEPPSPPTPAPRRTRRKPTPEVPA